MPRDERNHRSLVEEGLTESVLARMPVGLDTDFANLDGAVGLLRRYHVDKSADHMELWAKRKKYYLVAQDGKGRQEVIEAIRGETGRILPAEMGQGHTPITIVQNGREQTGSKPKRSFFAGLRPPK